MPVVMSTKAHKDGTAVKAVETTNGVTVESDSSNFGLIDYVVTFQATNEQVLKLAKLGALHIAQRAPASATEKVLAGYEKSRSEMGSTWTRKDIGYSEEIARQFEAEMTKQIAKVCNDPKNAPLSGIAVSVKADEYKSETRPVKYAEAKKAIQGALDNKALSKLVKTVGFKGSVTAETALENDEFIQAVDAERKARIAAMFA
jgi:hypothetical protein